MIIRNLKKSELDEYVQFNRKMYPEREGIKGSIKFKLECPDSLNEGGEYRTLIAYDEDKDIIVGQLQLLPCIIYKDGERIEGEWGMDFMVEKESRGKTFGLSLVKEALKKNHFGMGFAKKALSIHSFLGINLIGYFKKYIYFKSPIALIRFAVKQVIRKPLGGVKSIDRYPEKVSVGYKTYMMTDEYSLFKDEPYNTNVIEFGRDKHFMKWRFGTYPNVFKTYVESDGSTVKSFFVVREVIWKNCSFLMLVDYRYQSGEFKDIVKAAKKVLKKTRAMGIITVSSYYECDKRLRECGFFKFGQERHITSNAKLGLTVEDIKRRNKLVVTAADSDIDFYYGVKEWYQDNEELRMNHKLAQMKGHK